MLERSGGRVRQRLQLLLHGQPAMRATPCYRPPTQVLDAPIQRSFMGHLERTGPLEWLRLTVDAGLRSARPDWVVGHDYVSGTEEDAASQPAGATRCYVVDLGMAGGLARDQDEPPIAFNLGDNSSQRAYVDCDDGGLSTSSPRSSRAARCRPTRRTSSIRRPVLPRPQRLVQPAQARPVRELAAVPVRAHADRQLEPGHPGLQRADLQQVEQPELPGRRHDLRQRAELLAPPEQRLRHRDVRVGRDRERCPARPQRNSEGKHASTATTLGWCRSSSRPMTRSPTPGNETYPIVGFGNFYVTGYGEVDQRQLEGRRPRGPVRRRERRDLLIGAGNEPPPDIDMSRNTSWVWGHFVKDVVAGAVLDRRLGRSLQPRGELPALRRGARRVVDPRALSPPRNATSSAVTPPPRNRPRRVSRSSSPRPFALRSTRPRSARRSSATRSTAPPTSAISDRLVEA